MTVERVEVRLSVVIEAGSDEEADDVIRRMKYTGRMWPQEPVYVTVVESERRNVPA